MLKSLVAPAGIERRVHSHGLRHTMAAELLSQGASGYHIQLQLGHSDLSTTAAYLESIQSLELVEMACSRPRWDGADRSSATIMRVSVMSAALEAAGGVLVLVRHVEVLARGCVRVLTTGG